MSTAKRYSKQRFTILNELQKVTSHPTAEEVYLMTKKIIPNVSLGTVYRNLNNLEQDGTILKFVINGKEHFDGNAKPHIHLCCENCGEIKDVFEETEGFSTKILHNNSFRINNIVINGICKNCFE